MNIILYTVDCPKCKVLEKKLNNANISFEVCKDTKLMAERNISKLPMLEVDGEMLTFKEAVDMINKGVE
jgi:glutaredoxin